MANEDSTGTLKRADHPVRLTGTPNWHYASMRCAEDAARSLSVQYSTRRFTAAFDPDATPESLAELATVRDSYYLLAAAHRSAARRLERGERIRIRIESLVRPVVRLSLRLRRVVTR